MFQKIVKNILSLISKSFSNVFLLFYFLQKRTISFISITLEHHSYMICYTIISLKIRSCLKDSIIINTVLKLKKCSHKNQLFSMTCKVDHPVLYTYFHRKPAFAVSFKFYSKSKHRVKSSKFL